MKLNIAGSDDGMYHEYCIHCHAETVEHGSQEGRTYCYCRSCSWHDERSLIIDPAIMWWKANNQEYWHESAGIFIRSPKHTFLFFERVKFPYALTVPAGHVDAGEQPGAAAHREVAEEVGITQGTMIKFAAEDIVGDSCRRGADAHRWNAYLLLVDHETDVALNDEGRKPCWMTFPEALQKDLTYPVRYFIEKYSDTLLSTVV